MRHLRLPHRLLVVLLVVGLVLAIVATRSSSAEASTGHPAVMAAPRAPDIPVTPASNGNLSSIDNCEVARVLLQAYGFLPGNWATWDAYRWLGTTAAFYGCRYISLTWGFAVTSIEDHDYVFYGGGQWSIGPLHFSGWYREDWGWGYTAQMCGGVVVASGHPCSFWE